MPVTAAEKPSTRIREIRKRRGLTLQVLADRVGTTAQTIQRLETDNMMVSIEWLRRIADALQLSPSELVTTDRLATLPYLGTADAAGTVQPTATDAAPFELRLPHAEPLVVRLAGDLGSYAADTLLIGARIDHVRDLDATGCDCIVGMKDGSVHVRHVARSRAGKLVVRAAGGAAVDAGADIEWIAPVRLALRVVR